MRTNGRGISGSEKNLNKSMKETNVGSSRKAALVEQRVCIEKEGNELKIQRRLVQKKPKPINNETLPSH